MTNLFRILTIFVALIMAPACVSTGAREITAPDLTNRLEAGKSTKSEVTAMLGLPAIVTYGRKGQETWEYYYVTEYPLAVSFIPVVDAWAPGFNQNTRTLTVSFDRQGLAQSFQRRQTVSAAEHYPY